MELLGLMAGFYFKPGWNAGEVLALYHDTRNQARFGRCQLIPRRYRASSAFS
jgi:hypothetical protein